MEHWNKKLEAAVDSIEKPFIDNKPRAKVAYFKMLQQLPRPYRAYGFDKPDERGEFVRLFYDYMRAIDDIVDGDGPMIDQIDANEFIESCLARSAPPPGSPRMDIILDRTVELADSIGFTFMSEYDQLIDSMKFDLERRSNLARHAIILSPQAEIDQRFFDNFINPTLGLMARTVDQPMTSGLNSLGRASRRYYNLHDLFEDISRGLINVSQEDATVYGLDEDSFLSLAQRIDEPLIEQQKQYGVKDATIQRIMGEGLTAWAEQALDRGQDDLRAWQGKSCVNSIGHAAADLLIVQKHPRDTLMFFAYEMGADRFYKKTRNLNRYFSQAYCRFYHYLKTI